MAPSGARSSQVNGGLSVAPHTKGFRQNWDVVPTLLEGRWAPSDPKKLDRFQRGSMSIWAPQRCAAINTAIAVTRVTDKEPLLRYKWVEDVFNRFWLSQALAMEDWRDSVEGNSGVPIHMPRSLRYRVDGSLNQDKNATVAHPAASARVLSGLSIAQAKGGTEHV